MTPGPPITTPASQHSLPLDDPRRRSAHLSKSRFVAGTQCHKLLWWKVHDRDAPELQPDKVLQDLFDQGRQVGLLAQEQFPGGVLIDLPHDDYQGKIAATQRAMAAGAPAIFEASYSTDSVFVAVDVLLREGDGWRLIEVKSSSSLKPEHLHDAAIQLHVLRRCGLAVRAVEVMHLNRDYRLPASSREPKAQSPELFVRADVTADVEPLLAGIPAEIEAQLAMLAGSLPEVRYGLHCSEPRDCPFMERCWPQERDHIRKLYNVGAKTCHRYLLEGVERIGQIPPKKKLPPAAQRQIRAMTENRIVVEPTLAQALEPFTGRLGFLDFETISRAVPVWPEMKPWMPAAAQFSYHETQPDGTYGHAEWLASGPNDARPLLAEAMIAATRKAQRVATYSSYEKTRIRDLQESVPDLRSELVELEMKLIDLLPVVRENVYHPDFEGSFSLKFVLSPLVPELKYSDLVIVNGMEASVEIARLLFVADRIPAHEKERVRVDLLAYCKQDTWAMVRLLEEMRKLAGISPKGYPPLRLA